MYLNGPRTLSDERLSFLVFSTPEATFTSAEATADQEQEYDMHLFCTHFLGDGMALHTTANELFTLLADRPTEQGVECANIEAVVGVRKAKEGASADFELKMLAQAMECKLVTPEGWGRMAWAGARVEFNNLQARQIVRAPLFVCCTGVGLTVWLNAGRASVPSRQARRAQDFGAHRLLRYGRYQAGARRLQVSL